MVYLLFGVYGLSTAIITGCSLSFLGALHNHISFKFSKRKHYIKYKHTSRRVIYWSIAHIKNTDSDTFFYKFLYKLASFLHGPSHSV